MSDQSLIQAEQLTRFYGSICAVKSVSFCVQRGEVLGLLGPNGAGKTTTLQLLTGNLAPTSGRIMINGIDLLTHPKSAKMALGYLPEQPPVYREFTVDEYLIFCAKLNRVLSSKITAAVDLAKQRCGLTNVGKRLIANLSKGYQQRVGIAQALVHQPAVVILDEPTVGLDPLQIQSIRAMIRELKQDHGVILSSHILPEIQAICDRVMIMHNGELVLTDSLSGLQQHMQVATLNILFRQPPTTEQLMTITGIVSVDVRPSGGMRVQYYPEVNPAEAIVIASVQNSWGLYELVPEKFSLEQVFLQLTCAEPNLAVDVVSR